MEKVYARTKGIRDDMVSGFCPGCMHSTVIKLIGEVLEEMHLLDKAACAVGVGCCGLHMRKQMIPITSYKRGSLG